MGELQSDHGGQSCHGASEELGSVDKELRVQEEHTTEPKVPLLETVHKLSHNRYVGVQLYLPWGEEKVTLCSSSKTELKIQKRLHVN